ncbi:hypothetical protein BVRB_9g215590 [Beta vulgaris subsp. vulgaris]|nr:hypothetical protein BVRB_9g215590 [Beta vulgaris subsp. vulgaris]
MYPIHIKSFPTSISHNLTSIPSTTTCSIQSFTKIPNFCRSRWIFSCIPRINQRIR